MGCHHTWLATASRDSNTANNRQQGQWLVKLIPVIAAASCILECVALSNSTIVFLPQTHSTKKKALLVPTSQSPQLTMVANNNTGQKHRKTKRLVRGEITSTIGDGEASRNRGIGD